MANDSKFLTMADILAADDVEVERVEVPEWGGHVFLRGLTGRGRDDFEMRFANWSSKDRDPGDFRAELLSRCLCNADGKRICVSKQVSQLALKSGRVLVRLFDIARRLSGLTEEDVEDLEKNLPSDQSDDSGSD